MRKNHYIPLAVLVVVSCVAIWSVIAPHDMFTWRLETFPAFIAAALLIATYKRFRFTDLLYILVGMHCIILFVGGHYTYAEVPLFEWLKEPFGFARNHYDRVGHFAQGFVPAMVGRELLLRNSSLGAGKWLFALLVLSCLGISACYEILEWTVAVLTGDKAEAFLGTQGDVWDTQKDMFFALCGAVTALLSCSNLHDYLIRKQVNNEAV